MVSRVRDSSGSGLNRYARLCFSAGIPKRSALVAIVVGTILNLINQGDALFRGEHIDLLKLALTYVVPYCVATYGAVSYRLRMDATAEADPP